MKTYYSIISVATKPQLNEKIHLGLLCVTPQKSYFHFSKRKFKIISKLLNPQTQKLALSALQGIHNEINHIKSDVATEGYLNYLSRYNNGLIQFSSSTKIDLMIDESMFHILFRKYIFSKEKF